MIPDERDDARLPVLSIVIVNSDGVHDTLGCLSSLFQHAPDEALEVILVDNCSQDSCLDTVQERFPQVRTLSAAERQGFSKNYNLGMRQSRGKYVLILNNDTIVHKGALNALLTAMRENPDYGLLGGQLLSSKGRIQPECVRSLPTPLTFVLTQLVLDPSLPTGLVWRRYLSWRLSKRPSGPVPCISGACMLTSRAVLEAVGFLDESYDFYYEDIEWCHRMWRHDMVVAYVADAHITHLGDQSLSRAKVWAAQSEYRSALRYFREYRGLGPQKTWLLWTAAVLSYHLRAVAFAFLERVFGKAGHAQAYSELSEWILRQRPDKLRSNDG